LVVRGAGIGKPERGPGVEGSIRRSKTTQKKKKKKKQKTRKNKKKDKREPSNNMR